MWHTGRAFGVAGAFLAALLYQPQSVADSLTFYGGASAALSRLQPDTDRSSLDVDDEISNGIGLFAGVDVVRRVSLELGYIDLGNAKLSDGFDVGYSAVHASALFQVLGDGKAISRREGTSGFVRLGVSRMSNDADIELDDADSTGIVWGAGVNASLSNRWRLRGELVSYDVDAAAIQVGVVFRPWERQIDARADVARPLPSSPAPAATPVPEPVTVPEAAEPPVPAPVPEPAPLPEPEPELASAPEPAQDPEQDAPPATARTRDSGTHTVQCQAAGANEPRDASGCALFSGTLASVNFEGASDELTESAQQRLTQLAQSMLANPEAIIEVGVHTRSYQSEEFSKRLATRRALSVARHLVSQGVPVQQLRARSFGDMQAPSPVERSAGIGYDRVSIKPLNPP